MSACNTDRMVRLRLKLNRMMLLFGDWGSRTRTAVMSEPESTAREGQVGVSFLNKFASSKGSLTYLPNQSFLLHVVWQAPSLAAAQELLSGLRACAAATFRDTPCVTTYFFRLSPSYHDVCSPVPLLLKDHPHIAQVVR
jgi:hypothetical protein